MDIPYDPLLQQARRSFRAFYSIATPEDATWFDSLVVAHVALTEGMQLPRAIMPDASRTGLERACDKVERQFMQARDRVRECPTFRAIGAGEQNRIAAILFELFPPGE